MVVSRQEMDDIVLRYKDAVWRVALSVSKNREDAKDIFQDVFVALVKSIHKIENEEHLERWLIRATVNRGYSLSKTVWKMRVGSYDKLHEEYGDMVEPTSEEGAASDEEEYNQEGDSGGFNPDTAQTEVGEKIMTALMRIKREYRTVLNLHYYNDIPIKEIAKMLNMTENAIKQRLFRARKMLEKEVKMNER